MRATETVEILEVDEETARALLATPHGPLVATCTEHRREPYPPLAGLSALAHLLTGPAVSDRTIEEHLITLSPGSATSWRGEPLAPFTLEFPAFQDPGHSAGTAPRLSYESVAGGWDWQRHAELRRVLITAHRLAAEALVDPYTLHAERLHWAYQRILAYRVRHIDATGIVIQVASEEALRAAELAYLHLCATEAHEEALREVTRRLAPEWTGTPEELLAAARRLLA